MILLFCDYHLDIGLFRWIILKLNSFGWRSAYDFSIAGEIFALFGKLIFLLIFDSDLILGLLNLLIKINWNVGVFDYKGALVGQSIGFL